MRRLLIALLALSSAAAVAGEDWMARLQPADDAWKRVPQELVFINESEPQTLDPARMTGLLEGRLAMALFEGLCSLDPITLEPRPGLAERWEVSADGLDYVFHLRADAAWSDGQPVLAQHVIDGWRRVLTPATTSEYASQLYAVAGAEEMHKGRGDWSGVAASAPDQRTVRVRLRSPTPWFLELTSFPTLSPIRLDVIAAHGERWTRAGNLVGNGPFRLAAWEPRVSIVMVRNQHYRGAAQPKLAKITALPTDDLETAWRMYQQGGVHWMPAVPAARIDAIGRHPDFTAVPSLGCYFYRFNCTREPFTDARVRRAFSLAIDRAAIASFVTRGGELPSASLIPTMPAYQRLDLPLTDRAEARRLLAEAGYAAPGGSGGKPLPPIDILFNTSENQKAIAEAIAAQWKDALGAAVTARNSEWKVYLDAQDNLDYMVCRAAWFADYNDPNTFLDLWETGNGNNRTGWSNADFDRMLKESQREADPARRRALMERMERLLVAEACPIAPIYIYVAKSLRQERLGGFWDNNRDQHPFQWMWIDP